MRCRRSVRCWCGISPASSRPRSWKLSARTARSKTCVRASPRSSCHRRRQPKARVLCHRCTRIRICASASSERQGFHEYFAFCEGCHLSRHKLSAEGLARTPLYQKSVCVHGVLQHHSSMHSSHAEQSTYSVQQHTTTSPRRHLRCAAFVLVKQPHPNRMSGRNPRSLTGTPSRDGWKTSSSGQCQHTAPVDAACSSRECP